MSVAETCSTCRFFLAATTGAELFKPTGGMCRRYAPSGPAIAPSASSWQVFPPMTAHQWCGDYRPNGDAAIGSARLAA